VTALSDSPNSLMGSSRSLNRRITWEEGSMINTTTQVIINSLGDEAIYSTRQLIVR